MNKDRAREVNKVVGERFVRFADTWLKVSHDEIVFLIETKPDNITVTFSHDESDDSLWVTDNRLPG